MFGVLTVLTMDKVWYLRNVSQCFLHVGKGSLVFRVSDWYVVRVLFFFLDSCFFVFCFHPNL